MPHATRGWITYTPSVAGWSNMSIKADAYTAANNGQQLAITPPVNNFWPLIIKIYAAFMGSTIQKRKTRVLRPRLPGLFMCWALHSVTNSGTFTL